MRPSVLHLGDVALVLALGCAFWLGQRVIVSYEEQDSCGFFNQVDYIGRVVSIDPFDGLLVKFDVADASGDVLWVDDSDEWAWAV